MKFHKTGQFYTYIYELPLNNWAVVKYLEDEEIVFSQFFWEWADALHCFNKIKDEEEQ